MRTTNPRVAHVVPALFDEKIGIIGGAERYALELAREMSDATPTTLISFGPDAETRREGNLQIEIVGGGRAIRNDPYDRFSPEMFDHLENADVVHCHQAHSTASIMAAQFCRRTSKPVFVTDLGGGPNSKVSRVTDDMFDAHLHISRFSRSLWADSNARQIVISCGVDSIRFSPASQPPTEFRAIFVGRILPHKGIDVLIDALPDGMQLDVVGRIYDDRYFGDLQTLARDESVSFLKDANDEALVTAYQSASVVVLPSVYRTIYGNDSFAPELLGQALLEGMACGLPAIASDAGAMPEVIVDGTTGFVVPEGDVDALRLRLTRLRDDPGVAQAMGQAARKHVVENFSWAAVVGRCLDAYAS